jgi:hypothetical protein
MLPPVYPPFFRPDLSVLIPVVSGGGERAMQTAVAEVTPRPARIDVYRRESGHCRAVHPHADRRPPGL